jgi:hypothetical protein
MRKNETVLARRHSRYVIGLTHAGAMTGSMTDFRRNCAGRLIAVLSTALLLTSGCDLFPPDYTPPGQDHEVSGQVLWVDRYSEKASYDPSPPNEDDCLSKGFKIHSSRLKGTEREVLEGAGSAGPSSASDVVIHRSSGQAYWATRVSSGPPCAALRDVVQIERVRPANGESETLYQIDNEKNGNADRSISALAVASSRLVWTETASEGLDETTAVLKAPLSPEVDSLRPDTLYKADGGAEALEAGPDAEAIYWNTADGWLFQTDVDGKTTRLSSSFSGQVEAIGGNPARIYWSSGSSLRSIALGGSGRRRDGTLPEGTTAIGLGPKDQRIFAGTAGENKKDEGIWVAPLSGAEASAFDKCVGEGKSGETISGDRHREDFRSPQSLAVLYDENG